MDEEMLKAVACQANHTVQNYFPTQKIAFAYTSLHFRCNLLIYSWIYDV